MAGAFQFVGFSQVRRLGNNVAHALARRAVREPNLTIWMEDVPQDIHYFVQVDLANIE